MIIVRDMDISETRSQEILDRLNLGENPIMTLTGKLDPVSGPADGILFITAMQSGWLGYHKKFFYRHREEVPLWVVLLVNEDPVVHGQAVNGFSDEGIHLVLWTIGEHTDYASAAAAIAKARKVKKNKALLYSLRPNCGKRTLGSLLKNYLPDWDFETAEEDSFKERLEESDAGRLIIVGKHLKDLSVPIPEGASPFYVLTMPDESVQAYLHFDELMRRLPEYIPPHLKWTKEMARTRLFYISPLYEQWQEEQVNPIFDERFLIWDEFGLPLPRKTYRRDRVDLFLRQFCQGRKLAEALKG